MILKCVVTSDTFRIGFYGGLARAAVPRCCWRFPLVLMMRWAAGAFLHPRSRRRCPAWLVGYKTPQKDGMASSAL